MTKHTLTVNKKTYHIEAANDMPLLWVLRDLIALTGTKFGCGKGLCGACTVHVNGEAVRSCQLPVAQTKSLKITTIEGLSTSSQNPVKKAWMDLSVAQCGYCQPGQIMQATALLKSKPKPSVQDIEAAMSGNLCRCGTYGRIKNAILKASGQKTEEDYT